jgi:EAL domain-containing protein (putative c-di-GMP-specific phosphodiesterase class I)
MWRHRKASGEAIDVEITSHSLTFAGRKARLVIANDVTERVRAEGVETAQQAQVLNRLGCSYVQGHLFSEAVDADAAGRLVASDAPFRPAAAWRRDPPCGAPSACSDP